MDHYANALRSPRPKGLGLGLVVLLHLLLLWAIQSGLARLVTQKAKVVVDAVLLSEDKPAIPPPPAPKNLPPPPKTTPPPPAYVPPVQVPVAAPAAANAIAAVSNTPTPPAPAAPVVPSPRAEPVRTGAVGIACQPPEYPRAAVRMEEEGEVAVSYVISEDGHVAKVVVTKSSGYKRLDEAAVQQVYKWRFKPATVDGKPVEQTKTKNMRFRLTNEPETNKQETTTNC